MLSKNERGYSLIEIIFATSILLIAGAMITRYMGVSRKAAQEIEGKNLSHQDFMNTLQKIRRDLTMRDSKQAITTQSDSMSIMIPTNSTSSTNYTLTLTSRCRPLATGETLDLSQAKQGKTCLETLKCSQGVPYVEWRYTNHPNLTSRDQPDNRTFAVEMKKTFGSPGLGLCFTQTADSLTIEGVQVRLKKDGQVRIADLASESLTIPIGKRNNIEIIP